MGQRCRVEIVPYRKDRCIADAISIAERSAHWDLLERIKIVVEFEKLNVGYQHRGEISNVVVRLLSQKATCVVDTRIIGGVEIRVLA